jgi:hypothetical protein
MLTRSLSKSQVDIVDDRVVLNGAHGDDIVRSIFVDDKVRAMVYRTYPWPWLTCLGWSDLHCRRRWQNPSLPISWRN